MSLYDAIEEIDEKIAKRDGKEPKAKEPVEETPAENIEAETVEPAEKVEVAEKEPDPAPKPVPAADNKPDNAAFARMRMDKQAAERRAEEAERRAAQLAQQPKPQEVTKPVISADVEPDKATNWEGWLEWRNRQLEAAVQNQGKTVEEVKAWKEAKEKKEQAETRVKEDLKVLEHLEKDFAKDKPDYADVRAFALNNIAHGIRVLNPGIQGPALNQAVQTELLRIANHVAANGYHPIEYLYNQAREWGYQPKAAPVEDTPEPVASVKPTIKQIADNKKKTAPSFTAGGKSGAAPMSRDAVKGMKFHEIAKLSPEQFHEWESTSKQLEAGG